MSTPYTLMKNAVEELSSAFEEFKHTQEERVAALEKNKVDPIAEDKISRLNTVMNDMHMKIQKISVVPHRPGTDVSSFSSHQDTEHKKAFLDYLRKGREEILFPFEKKSFTGHMEGGILLPTMLALEISENIHQHSLMRSLASIISISRSQYELLIEEKPGNFLWAADENKDKYNDDEYFSPKIKKLIFPIQKIISRQHISQDLLDDSSFDLGSWLVEKITNTIMKGENKAFLLGDGKNCPEGIAHYETSEEPENGKLWVSVSDKANNLPENLSEFLINLVYSLETQYLSRSSWILSREVFSKIRALKDTNGAFLWQPFSHESRATTFLGYPVFLSDDLPPLAEEGTKKIPILFGDFREAYQIVDRQDISVIRDPYSAKPDLEIDISKRVGGGMKNFHAIRGVLVKSE